MSSPKIYIPYRGLILHSLLILIFGYGISRLISRSAGAEFGILCIPAMLIVLLRFIRHFSTIVVRRDTIQIRYPLLLILDSVSYPFSHVQTIDLTQVDVKNGGHSRYMLITFRAGFERDSPFGEAQFRRHRHMFWRKEQHLISRALHAIHVEAFPNAETL